MTFRIIIKFIFYRLNCDTEPEQWQYLVNLNKFSQNITILLSAFPKSHKTPFCFCSQSLFQLVS